MLRYSPSEILSESAVTDIFFKAQAELEKRKQLYERVRRKLTDEEIASLSDDDIKVPLELYISIMSAGYFGGKAPVYKVKAYNKERNKIVENLFDKKTNSKQDIKEIEELISHIVDYNDDADLFFKEVFDFLTKRACYEMYYKDKDNGEITIVRSDALETVAIWDYSLQRNLIGIYRIIQTTMADGKYQNIVELTTQRGKRYYNDTPEKRNLFGTPEYEQKYGDEPLFKENKKDRKTQRWDEIPATAIENELGLAIFEPVISLIEAYQTSIQNSRNTFKYNDEAKMAIVGYSSEQPRFITDERGNEIVNPLREKEDEEVLKAKVLYLDKDGKAAWIEKNVNDSAVQNHKKTLMDIICLCSFCPNMTDLGFTAADNNSALEKKFFSLQQYIATFEGDFRKGLLRRWEVILQKINKDKGRQYDFRDIETVLKRNMPTDTKTETDRALSLRSILSDETVINMLPDDLDAKSELDKMNEQNKNNSFQNFKNLNNQNNKKFEIEEKEDVGISRPTVNGTESTVSSDERTNTE